MAGNHEEGEPSLQDLFLAARAEYPGWSDLDEAEAAPGAGQAEDSVTGFSGDFDDVLAQQLRPEVVGTALRLGAVAVTTSALLSSGLTNAAQAEAATAGPAISTVTVSYERPAVSTQPAHDVRAAGKTDAQQDVPSQTTIVPFPEGSTIWGEAQKLVDAAQAKGDTLDIDTVVSQIEADNPEALANGVRHMSAGTLRVPTLQNLIARADTPAAPNPRHEAALTPAQLETAMFTAFAAAATQHGRVAEAPAITVTPGAGDPLLVRDPSGKLIQTYIEAVAGSVEYPPTGVPYDGREVIATNGAAYAMAGPGAGQEGEVLRIAVPLPPEAVGAALPTHPAVSDVGATAVKPHVSPTPASSSATGNQSPGAGTVAPTTSAPARNAPTRVPAHAAPAHHAAHAPSHEAPATPEQMKQYYNNPFRDAHLPSEPSKNRIDQGVDYANGSGPVYALGTGTVLETNNSGWSEYGDGSNGYILIEIMEGPLKGLRYYTAEGINPTVGIGDTVHSTTVIGNLIPADGIEIGWGPDVTNWSAYGTESQTPDGGRIGASTYAITHSIPTRLGLNMNDLLVLLGAPSGVNEQPGQTPAGDLPARYKLWSSNAPASQPPAAHTAKPKSANAPASTHNAALPAQEHYPTHYTIHTDLMSPSGLTVEQLNRILDRYAAGTPLAGQGQAFLNMEMVTGFNALFMVEHAGIESAWGGSEIARLKDNLFGYGADNANPLADAYTFSSYEACIDYYAHTMLKHYLTPGADHYNGATAHGIFVDYSTSHDSEAESIVSNMNRDLALVGGPQASHAAASPSVPPASPATPSPNATDGTHSAVPVPAPTHYPQTSTPGAASSAPADQGPNPFGVSTRGTVPTADSRAGGNTGPFGPSTQGGSRQPDPSAGLPVITPGS